MQKTPNPNPPGQLTWTGGKVSQKRWQSSGSSNQPFTKPHSAECAGAGKSSPPSSPGAGFTNPKAPSATFNHSPPKGNAMEPETSQALVQLPQGENPQTLMRHATNVAEICRE